MKRTLLITSLSLAAAGSAFAQSSVTVWGRLNVSAEAQELGNRDDKTLANNASRLGFRGVEDLGGGLKAGFAIEHGFDPTTGQSNTAPPNGTNMGGFWGRGSEVFLGSKFGTVRVGNYTSEAYYATADWVSMHNHDTGSSADALYAYLPNDTNKISYRTPEFAGLWGEIAVSEAQYGATDKGYDLAVNYALGGLAAGLGYQKVGDVNQIAVRAAYTFGGFTVGGYYQLDEDALIANGGKRNNFRLSGMYALGANEFHLNYGWADDYDNVSDSSAQQATVAYGYNLSKRTRVYAFYTKLDGDSNSYAPDDFSSIALGVRHNF
jgi:predicted porin